MMDTFDHPPPCILHKACDLLTTLAHTQGINLVLKKEIKNGRFRFRRIPTPARVGQKGQGRQRKRQDPADACYGPNSYGEDVSRNFLYVSQIMTATRNPFPWQKKS